MKIQDSMDSAHYTDDHETKNVDNVGNEANAQECHGNCKKNRHAQYALVHSTCPLPENFMIGVVGRPIGVFSSHNSDIRIKNQLVDSLCQSQLR